MNNGILYIENFLPSTFQNSLENLLCSENFPYFFVDNIAYDSDDPAAKYQNLDQYGFFHTVYFNGKENSLFFKDLLPITYFLENNIKNKIKSILRIRIGMQVKVKDANVTHSPHIDFYFPHKVLLYYVHDTDGDTVFYKKNLEDYIEIQRITPKKGAAVIFDGDIYHASTTPCKNQRRIAININYEV